MWCADAKTEGQIRHSLERMTATLLHRGPDASGFFVDPDDGMGFGHRRLSILDLSEQGSQPMWSRSGRYCITYNGEVYNAPELRADLERNGWVVPWRGHSDTEVVLEAIEALGLREAVGRFNGMFAFGLWDHHSKSLSLVRDRLGIKPLMYVRGSFGLAFASELRALLALDSFQAKLNRTALLSFLRYAVIPNDECIVDDVCKVEPGTIVELKAAHAEATITRYWSARQVAADGLSRPFEGTDREAIDELERLIQRSVVLRMRTDVPFGAFLSGGIDSSTVVALMGQASSSPVKTFCIGNEVSGYDESVHARRIASHLGSDHHTLVAEPAEMVALVPEIAGHWDEPFADSSQIPTFLVSRLTRGHVTVSLSGDGGDELFAGYNRHAWAPRLWALASRMPGAARRALRALKLVAADDWDRAFRAVGLGDALRLPGDKIYKVAALSEVDTAHEFYERLRSHWPDPARVLAGSVAPAPSDWDFDAPFAEQMMLSDLVQYLPDDILTKVDRASMAVSLEARVPLLDHQIVELAWRLPRRMKIRGRTQKWILRQVLARHVPSHLFERPKTGFGVPVGDWIKGPLEGWAASLLDEGRLVQDGIFDPAAVSTAWAAHKQGRGNHGQQLWAILMFQSWWATNRQAIEA